MSRTERPVTEKEIYIWNMIGNVLGVTESVFFLIAVTRLSDSAQSDAFNLGWSFSYLMLTIGGFSVRIFQATDVKEQYSFRQYSILRYCTVVAMGLTSVLYVILNRHTTLEVAVILLLCASKAIEAISDLFQGRFHQKERLDLAGKAITARVVLTFVTFVTALLVTHDVIVACVVSSLVSLACLVLFEIRFLYATGLQSKEKREGELSKIPELALQCLPLFLNAFLLMFVFNEPKEAIADAIAEGVLADGAQTAYSVLFMPSLALNLLILVLYPLITKMALLWASGNSKGYVTLLLRIVGALTAMSVVILGVAYLIGIPVLQILFGIDLDGKRTLFLILLAGGCSNALMNVFSNAITVIRKHYALLPGCLVVAGFVWFFAHRMVESEGLLGAGKVFLISQAALLLIDAGVFVVMRPKGKKEEVSK